MRISIESGISLTAIRSYLLGEHVHESTRKGIETAATKLRIRLEVADRESR
jgi:hypothetical protein